MALGALLAFGAVLEEAIAAIGFIPKRLVTNARILNISQQEQQHDSNEYLSFSDDGSHIETPG